MIFRDRTGEVLHTGDNIYWFYQDTNKNTRVQIGRITGFRESRLEALMEDGKTRYLQQMDNIILDRYGMGFIEGYNRGYNIGFDNGRHSHALENK